MLPQNTSVTVNGLTYTNEDWPDDFVIGPLQSFAIIELLSQPIFFWRRREDVYFNAPCEPTVSQEEFHRRDNVGDGVELDLSWRGLEFPSGERPQDLSLEITAQADIPPDGRVPPHGTGYGFDDNSSEENEDGTEGLEVEEGDEKFYQTAKDVFSGSTPCDYLRRQLSGLDGPIQRYRDELGGTLKHHIVDLVDAVLSGINALQAENAGFSMIVEDRLLRPGRPSFSVMRGNEGRPWLVVTQFNQSQNVTLHVLDPMVWNSKKKDRKQIYRASLDRMLGEGWLYNIVGDVEEKLGALPLYASWAESAQTVDLALAVTYTVLNAWALAMGLFPDPRFELHRGKTEETDFLDHAESIFALALRGRYLDWKLLLAFFICHGYNKDGDVLPPLDRRFSLRGRSARSLRQRELQVDRAWRDAKEQLEVIRVVQSIGLDLGSGTPHDEDFRSDTQTDDFREKVVKTLITENAWDPTLSDGDLQERYNRLPASSRRPSSSSFRQSSSTSTASLRFAQDPSDIPAEFDPCEYFNEALGDLTGRYGLRTDIEPQALGAKYIFDSIASVSQAITWIQPLTEGLGVIDYATLESFIFGSEELPEFPSLYDGRPLFLPWTENNYSMLVAVQAHVTDEKKRITVSMLDPALWLSSRKQRLRIYTSVLDLIKHIHWDDYLKPAGFTTEGSASWITSLQAGEPWHTGYYTIFNAWAILFSLPLNPLFRPSQDFFEQAGRLIRLSLGGFADWKLIWSLLLCSGFVMAGEPVAECRITKTVPSRRLELHLSKLRRRFKRLENPTPARSWTHIFPPSSRAHDDIFPSDDWTAEDIRRRVPRLVEAGIAISHLPLEELGEAFKVLRKKPTSSDPGDNVPQPFVACSYLHDRIRKALGGHYVKNSFEKLKQGGDTVTTERKIWMMDSEVSLAIASVTLAISNIQNSSGGFSFLHQDNVQLCNAFPYEDHQFDAAIRPGRPMMVPLQYGNHIVLLVLQLNEQGDPTVSVLDSRPYHYNRAQRERVYDTVATILKRSRWWRHFFPAEGQVPIPEYATWVPCAIQIEDWTCGYLVILNAWALAMGLQPNPQFRPDWDSQFFNDLQNVIHLVRIGSADWKVIYAFLRCYDVVEQEEHVPELKKFRNTLRVMSEASVAQSLRNIRESEEQAWQAVEAFNIENVSNRNRIAFGEGRRSDIPWGSDGWNESTKLNIIPQLISLGRMNLDYSDAQVRADFRTFYPDISRDQMRERVQKFLDQLKKQKKDPVRLPPEETVRLFQNYLSFSKVSNRKLHDERINKAPCGFWREYVLCYGELLKRNLWESAQIQDIGEYLEEEQVTLGIAAVVESIDRLQNEEHKNQWGREVPFAGGFTLASSRDLQCGRSKTAYLEDAHVTASRPRRCWLMPVVVDKVLLKEVAQHIGEKEGKYAKTPEAGHIILAVIQEVDPEYEDSAATQPPVHDPANGKRYLVYFLDSLPRYLRDAYDFLFERIIKAAGDLNWSTHREGGRIPFERAARLIEVPRQTNNWACGYHTIVNAWILALSLTPDLDAQYTERLYKNIHFIVELALAGLLDWKMLVAWLFCYGVTVERSVDQVPESRRFAATVMQEDEESLQVRISCIFNGNDATLTLEYPEANLPYSLDNNVDFHGSKWIWPDADEDGGLERAFEEADEWGPFDQTYSSEKDEVIMTDYGGLEFLDRISGPGPRVALLY